MVTHGLTCLAKLGLKRRKPFRECQELNRHRSDMFIHLTLAIGISSLVSPVILASPAPVQLSLSRRLRDDKIVRKASGSLPKKNVPLKNYYDGTDLQYVACTQLALSHSTYTAGGMEKSRQGRHLKHSTLSLTLGVLMLKFRVSIPSLSMSTVPHFDTRYLFTRPIVRNLREAKKIRSEALFYLS